MRYDFVSWKIGIAEVCQKQGIGLTGIGTIASGINAGGLGDLLFDTSRYSIITVCNSKVPFEIAI